MSNKSNEIFRFASFRGASDNLAVSIETAPFPKNDFLNELRRNADSTREGIITLIESKTLISYNGLKVLLLHKLSANFLKALEEGDSESASDILDTFSIRNETYFEDLLSIKTNWILMRSQVVFGLMDESQKKELREALERSLKLIACIDRVKKGEIGDEIQQLDFMHNAVIVTPSVVWSLNKTRKKPISILDVNPNIGKVIENIDLQKKTEYDFELINGMTEKFDAFYFETERQLFETATAASESSPINLDVNINASFVNDFKKSLSLEESATFEKELEGPLLSRTRDIVSALDVFGDQMNRVAKKSNVQLNGISEFSSIYSSGVFKNRKDFVISPTISSLGMMDLFVVREELARYEANEISHIENILQGEHKKRNHEKTTELETTQVETRFSETETEDFSETKDSFSLKNVANNELKKEFGFNAGLHVKSKYGVADITASTNTDFKRTKTESDSSTHSVSKDITKRSSEKVKESFSSTITNRSLVKVFEQNSHDFQGIENSISGIYKWVDKIQKVSLHHYGKRMVMEFMIPEPALYYLGSKEHQVQKEIPPFRLPIEKIQLSNYMSLAEIYGVSDIPLPPEQIYLVGYSWASEPNEQVDDHGQTTKSDKISIPDGYHPTHFRINVEIAGGSCDVALGGGQVVKVKHPLVQEGGNASDREDNDINLSDMNLWQSLSRWNYIGSNSSYANGHLPITMTVLDTWDNVATVNISIRCVVNESFMQEWRLTVHDKLRESYESIMRERQFREENSYESLFQVDGNRPSQRNRAIEKEEIKKFCIATMRERDFDEFDAISASTDDDLNREVLGINFGEFEKQSPVIRFFESAFEWDQMYYQLYPYFWGKKDGWAAKKTMEQVDSQHLDFMRAGAAKVVVALKPGFEDRVLHYLESDAEEEVTRINGSNGQYSSTSPNYTLWSEILTNRREDIIIGSTTLVVEQGSQTVQINGDSWKLTQRDRARNLYIEGELFTIKAISEAQNQFTIDRPYRLESSESAVFALESVQVGAPWEERLPTNLVILAENENQLN